MFGLLLVIHVLVGILLVIIILMQSGRGGGLTETFSGVESIFGTKTNTFLTRGTAVLAVIFLITSLSLTYLSRVKGESLLQKDISSKSESKPAAVPLAQSKAVSEPGKQTPEPQKPIPQPISLDQVTTAEQTVTVTPEQPKTQNIEKTEQATKQE